MLAQPPARQPLPQGLRIICVKVGDKYGDEYVEKLKAACERWIPHRQFICLTDKPIYGVECNPLPMDLPGWWAKLGLFAPGLFPGDNLYLDLDVVITGSLTPFIAALYAGRDKLHALDDFSYSLETPKKDLSPETARLLGGCGTINSSVMLWHGSTESAAWRVLDGFSPEIMEELHGDQNYITRALWPDGIKLLPKGIAESYKYGGRKVAPVVIFHGDPKPHEAPESWVAANWT